jgi:hypothetical protein
MSSPIQRRFSLIVHSPTLPSAGDRKLQELFHWNDPDRLVQGFVEDLAECSHGAVRFEVVERLERWTHFRWRSARFQ